MAIGGGAGKKMKGKNSGGPSKLKFRIKTKKGPKSGAANVSRKELMQTQRSDKLRKASVAKVATKRKALHGKGGGPKKGMIKGALSTPAAKSKEEIKDIIQHNHNRKANPSFDRDALQRVNDGLVETCRGLNPPVEPSPLAFYGLTITTLLSPNVPSFQIPYLCTILAASIPKISEGALRSRSEKLIEIITRGLASDNFLVINKSMKVAQAIACSMMPPTEEQVQFVRRLIPNKHNGSIMPLFLTLVRKWLVVCFEGGHYDFFFEHLVQWSNFFVEAMLETKDAVKNAAKHELTQLLLRTAKMEQIKQYADHWNQVMGSLATIFKSVTYRSSWNLGLEIIRDFFEEIAFVKRSGLVEDTMGADVQGTVFETVFPHGAILLKVIDKIRCLDDDRHNGACDQAITAMGRCMTVQEFLRLVPFDPHSAMDAIEQEAQNNVFDGHDDEDDEEDAAPESDDELAGARSRPMRGAKTKKQKKVAEIWKRSYVMTILRKTSSHDSLIYAASEMLPRIEDCNTRIAMYVSARRSTEATQWTVLHEQYWRIIVGFCHFPHKCTNESFVALAKALVGLLNTPHLANTAATAFHVLCGGMYNLSKAQGPDPDLFDEEDPEVLALQREMFNDEDSDPFTFHGITQEQAQACCDTFKKYSKVIMPKLCNAFETVDTTAVLNAITSFSKVCSDSVMATVLEGIITVGKNISAEAETGTGGFSETAKKKDHDKKLSNQRRVILDIAVSMVGTLSNDTLWEIYTNIVEPVLQDPRVQPTLQKKAYKLLLTMFDQRLPDIHTELPRILRVLVDGQEKVTAAGLKMRLKCLSWAVDAFKIYHESEMGMLFKHAVPELTLSAKQPSNAVRAQTMDIIEKMHRFTLGASMNPHELLDLVIAGLGGMTPMLVCGSIVIIAKLLWIGHNDYQPDYINRLVAVVSNLVDSVVPEVRTAAATFIKMCLKLSKKSKKVDHAVETILQPLLTSVAVVVSQPSVSASTRTTMRALVENCIKRYGQEKVENLSPEGNHKFISHIAKAIRRTERLRLNAMQGGGDDGDASPKFGEDLFAEAFMAVEGAEDGEDAIDAGDDMLEDGGIGRLVSSRTKSAKFFKDDVEEELGGVTVRFDPNGKLAILNKEERALEDLKQRREQMLKGKHGANLHGKNIAAHGSLIGTGIKRKSDDVIDFENDELIRLHGTERDFDRAMELDRSNPAKKMGPSAATKADRERAMEHREKKRQRLENSGVKTGDEFSTGKALGDVKRGNYDPFAYVPLHPRFLNKRHARERTDRLKVLTSVRGLKGEKAARALRSMKNGGEDDN